jgi:UDP-N-acetylmuramyl pentapeptide phosphotransferase/UDP-N-acetylglucosamine-1-phosphate transferase
MNDQYSLLAFLAPLVAGLLTLILTRLMLTSAVFTKIQDIPNSRSLHDKPVPRIGGLALMLGVLAAWQLIKDQEITWFYAGVMVLMLLSLVDDLKNLPAKWRLVGHLVVATGFISWGLVPMPIYWAALLVLGIVWMTNLYNFMDGANGIAGGMAAIGFSFYALAAGVQGDIHFAVVNLVVVSSSLAFLVFNFGRARVFMGDAGSIPMGFLSAVIGLIGWQKGLWPIWFPLVIFSSFIVDATATLFKRLLRGQRIWEAHREHYYQRLIQMGWSHQKTALVEYALMTVSGVIGLVSIRLPSMYALGLICACLVIKLLLMRLVDVRWRRHA